MDSSKTNVKRRGKKDSKVNRIVSLFEIPRPNKARLQRTNSLPPTKRNFAEEDCASTSTTKERTFLNGFIGKVHQIKEEIEHKHQRKEIVSTPRPVKKKHQQRKNYSQEEWLDDRDKIMEDLERLQEKIEDVSSEIQNSDTELELTVSGSVFGDISVAESLYSDNSDNTTLVGYQRFDSSELDNLSITDNETIDEECGIRQEVFEEAIDNMPSLETQEESTEEVSSDETGPRLDKEEDSVNEEEENTEQAETDSMSWWKKKSFVQLSSDSSSSKKNDSTKSIGSTLGRYIKNRRSKRNKRTDKRRSGMLQNKERDYSVKELAQRFESFKDAAECGETENFRKSFICEMDKEMEKMKHDGFEEDFDLSMDNLSLNSGQAEEEACSSDAADSALYERILRCSNRNHHPEPPDQTDVFGETLFSEDLEKGLSFVETYNADGKELVICSVQVDRQSVDLSSFDEIKENTHRNSNLLSNGERTLVLIEAGELSCESKSEGTDSKRTTIYSTTSGDSFEEEENDLDQQIYSAARRETYCDDKGIVRIERVAPYSKNVSEIFEDLMPDYISTNNNYYDGNYLATQQRRSTAEDEEHYYESVRLTDEGVVEVKKDTLQYILEEIKSTEKKYLEDIRRVLEEYKPFLTQHCPEKVDIVFGNIEQLYARQCLFASIFEHPAATIKDVIEAFIDFEDLFRLYPRYFKNSPKSNAAIKELTFIIKEQQERIQDKLTLSAYLLTPLQRIGKYKLFLENIIKQLEKEERPIGSAQVALDIIKKYMSRGNDAVAIASILKSPLHTKDYGSFISREKFSLIKPKRLELMVFLFEEVVVFTTEDPKNMEQFVYLQSIKTNDLRIATFDDSTLHLTDYTKTKRRNSSKYTYILDARNSKLKLAWKEQIEEILWQQMKKMKENTLKEYKNGAAFSKKLIPRIRENRSKSTGSSTFYVD